MPDEVTPQPGFDPAPEDTDSDVPLAYSTIPKEADYLVAFSTVPGQKAFRDAHQGSWFICLLHDVVEEYHESCDLLKMLTIVNDKMATQLRIKQISSPVHTLRRDIYL